MPANASRWILAASCLTLLVLRVSGAHLHLCFDGSEAPVNYHVADSGIHHADEHGHEPGHEESHDDRDLDVGQDALVKKTAGNDLTLAVIACALLLFFISRPRTAVRTDSASPPRLRHAAWLRPPLRGPPAFA